MCVWGGGKGKGGGGASKEDATYNRANKEHRVTGSKNAYLL